VDQQYLSAISLPSCGSDLSLQANPNEVHFSAVVGQSDPPPKTISLSASEDGNLSWTASSSAQWFSLSKSSGTTPADVLVTINASGLNAGTYLGMITVTAPDSENSPLSIPVSLTLSPANQPPTVNAGPDQTIILANPASLNGTVLDDGLPIPPGSLTTSWSKLSGPGTVTFGNPAAIDTTASFTAAGSYVLRLTASDGALTNSDQVTITVNSQAANQAPTVSAGPNQTITLPSSASLNGTVSDDGLPDPPGALTTSWSKLSGPGTVTFGNPAAIDTTASFTAAGSYVLRLTANDGGLSRSDDVAITANAAPAGQAVVSFTLINADTDQPIATFDPLISGVTLNLATLPTRNLNIRANTSPSTAEPGLPYRHCDALYSF
jgi:hypothetical protein